MSFYRCQNGIGSIPWAIYCDLSYSFNAWKDYSFLFLERLCVWRWEYLCCVLLVIVSLRMNRSDDGSSISKLRVPDMPTDGFWIMQWFAYIEEFNDTYAVTGQHNRFHYLKHAILLFGIVLMWNQLLRHAILKRNENDSKRYLALFTIAFATGNIEVNLLGCW